jgi:hypothetical protein
LIAEVKAYDDFITGNAYGYEIAKDGEDIDSCWGFSGDDFEGNGLIEMAKNFIESDIERINRYGIQQVLDFA